MGGCGAVGRGSGGGDAVEGGTREGAARWIEGEGTGEGKREGGIGRRGIQLDTIAMAHPPLVRH